MVKTYILRECKFRTDLHTHMNANLDPETLIALGAVLSAIDALVCAITGEMPYHVYFGHEQQIQICVIGHYESEQFTAELFQDIIRRECPGVPTFIAETNTNPIGYY